MVHNDKYSGLTDSQVSDSRSKYGDNLITPRKKESMWKLFFEKFNDPIIRILLIAAGLSFVISVFHNEYAETVGIFFAILLATGIAFWFEKDAQKKFEALNKITDQALIKVYRNKVVVEVPKCDIVVGDVVMFEAGEEIPADGELFESISLLIDESSLTGELSIHKTINPTEFDSEATYPSNWVYRSTKVLEGSGVMRVVSVGDRTEYGDVAKQSTEVNAELTPLAKQLESLAKLIGICGFSLAILLFKILLFKDIFFSSITYSTTEIITLFTTITTLVIASMKVWLPIVVDFLTFAKVKIKFINEGLMKWGWFKNIAISLMFFCVVSAIFSFGFGYDFYTSSGWIGIAEASRILNFFMFAVTLIVVSIPEGLPMSVTLSLALSMRRMLKTNNLVRKMHACETMGATTVICTDKTGTLTQNKMQVYMDFFHGKKNFDDQTPYSMLVKYGVSLNTTAFLDYSDPIKVTPIGNPTEAALLFWCDSLSINYNLLRESTEMLDRLSFSTENKFMATLIYSDVLKRKILLVKGAPEVILSKCDKDNNEGDIVPFSDKPAVFKQLEEMQEKAMRTLAFGYKEVDDDIDKISDISITDLTYVGFVAIADPIRDDVADAINDCLKASINVKVVTGDTSLTAREIAKQIGLWQDSDTDENIITGIDFEALSEEEAYERVDKIKIMCRARPSDKQRLVRLLQKRGEIVAVTGDGTNDAPALNRAHVGLSMGTGTVIAKEASDITLLDDSFSSIISAVVWGRSLYLNIQRFIVFQLTINITAMIVVLVGSFFGKELPLTVTQMLWVNLIMDTFAAGALASLPPSRKLLYSKPRSSNSFIITKSMGANILTVAVFFIVGLVGLMYYIYYIESNELPLAYSLTQFFTVFVLLQFWNMFNAKVFDTNISVFKSFKGSKSFLVVAGLILVGQYLIVTYGGDVFRTVPLSFVDWIKLIVITSSVLWIGEIVRFGKRIIKSFN